MDVPVVLLKDERLAVVNKPHGMIVHHPDGGADLLSTVEPLLGWKRVHACHRLDAAAAGALLLASPAGAAEGTALFAKRKVFKLYLAVCRGVPDFHEITIHAALRRDGRRSRAVEDDADEDDGMPATTEVTVVARGRDASVVVAHTRSGRFHQVRAHLAHAGHPISGDRQYGGGQAPCLALHAVRLAFPHPGRNHKVMDLVAPPWPAFTRTATRAGITPAQWDAVMARVAAWPVERAT